MAKSQKYHEFYEDPELDMDAAFHTRYAHAYVGFYVLAVVWLALLGAVYTWQHELVRSEVGRMRSAQTQVSALNQQLTAINAGAAPQAQPAANISTATWKSYCDVVHGQCFKYPADWQLSVTPNLTDQASHMVVTSPGNTMRLTYTNPDQQGSFWAQFRWQVAADVPGAPDLKIIGGYFLNGSASYQPMYAVVNVAAIAGHTPNAASPLMLQSAPRFADASGRAITFALKSSSANLTTTVRADAWFLTPDGQTALAIMQTLLAKK
ncbi:MAG TPA: hypothetical protein VLG11_01145 [Candidatus Saccharimonadales bacterium]|nr:hypothetical protein [Candidatus Saccharimonadales bacterium]